MNISKAQELIKSSYAHKDKLRGIDGTFMYLVEEVGELATALREESNEACASEFADCFAWLISLANLKGVNLEEAFLKKYSICSVCNTSPCICDTKP
jgi:NTP pyrophosphatase (non-canonical NTP hydrolase)